MGIFKKTIKYSKPSIEIDNKIKDLNEGINKTKSTLSEQKLSEEKVDEILSEEVVDIENWREIFDEETVSEYEQQIDEVRERHNDLIRVQGSLEYVKNKEVKEIFTELYQGEVERVVDTYVLKYSNDIINLREDLFHEIKKKPVVDLRVLEEKINLLTLKYNQLSEGLLNEPSTGLEDPVTFEQLKNHYQLLVGRLQEQLSTLGGGGEVRLQYLDDIVGIATNASAYDGKFLKYNHSLKKFEFVTVSGGGGGISLTDLSVTTNSVGTAALSYNNSNGVFTYTPPSFVGYATEGYVNNAVVGFITTGALSGYATEGYVNNAVENISAQTLTVAGVSTFSEDVIFTGANTNARWDHSTSDLILFDNTRLEFGSNKDFEIWHGGSHTYMKNSGGDLRIRGNVLKLQREDGSETYLEANSNQDVKLFYNGNEKFATTNTGAQITGICTATSFSGIGSNLTGLTGASAGTYGNSNNTPQITVDANGRITGISQIGISGGGGISGINIFNSGTSVGLTTNLEFRNNVTAVSSGSTIYVDVSGVSTANIIADTLSVSGVSTFSSDVSVNAKLKLPDGSSSANYVGFGNNDDLKIFHNGSHSIVRETGTGSLYLQSDDNVILGKDSNTEIMVKGVADGAVELYYDNVKKFETTGYGVTVYGGVNATGVSTFTNLNVSGISTFNGKTRILDDVEFHVGTNGVSGDYKFYRDSFNSRNILYEDISGAEARFISYVGGDTAAAFYFFKGGSALARFSVNNIELFANNAVKFETTASGINVIGHTETDTLNVSGVSTFVGLSTFAGGVNVTGVSTFFNNVELPSGQHLILGDVLDDSGNFKLYNGANEPFEIFGSSKETYIRNAGSNANGISISANGSVTLGGGGTGSFSVHADDDGTAKLYGSGLQKLRTDPGGVIITGICTATSFSGNGNDIVHSTWTLGANGSSHYTFTGPGGLSNTDDPKIYLARGQTYEFVNNSGGSHPFQIQQSNGSAYSTGVTNNGASSGTIRFEVPFSAPNTLQYKCTSHSSMGNTIIVYPDISP